MRLPFHKYVGPGNNLDEGEAVDSDDLIAQVHDNEYSQASRPEDIQEADRHGIFDFIGDFQDGNLHSAIGALGLAAKKAVEKHTGVLYGMPNSPKYQPGLGVPYKGSNKRGINFSQNSDVSYSGDEGEPQDVQHVENAQVHAGASGQPSRSDRIRVYGDTQIEPPRKKVAIVQPNSQDNINSAADLFRNFNPSMSQESGDVDMGAPGDVRGTAVGTKAGSGPGMGSAGVAALDCPNIINVSKIGGLPFKHKFSQSFRFVVPACLSAQAVSAVSSTVAHGSVMGKTLLSRSLKIGSSLGINMLNQAQYMDANNWMSLNSNCAEWYAHDATLNVISLGVRAPYSTNTSNIEVANSNLQAQVMDISDLQEDYPINIVGEDNTTYVNKMWGNAYKPATVQDYTTDFNNVSARFETRALRRRVEVRDYLYAGGTATPLTYGDYDIAVMDVNLINYIRKSVNGSNLLGTAFKHRCAINRRVNFNSGTARKLIPASGSGTVMANQNDNGAGRTLIPTVPLDANEKDAGINNSNESFDKQAGALQYKACEAGLAGIVRNDLSNISGIKDTYALYAIYNIRNISNDLVADTGNVAYNAIVDLNWEVILNFELNVSGVFLTPMYANVFSAVTGFRNHRKLARDGGDNGVNAQQVYTQGVQSSYPGIPTHELHTLSSAGGGAFLSTL